MPPYWINADWQRLSAAGRQKETAKWKKAEEEQQAANQPSSSSSGLTANCKTAGPTIHIVEFCCSDNSELGVASVCAGLVSHRFSKNCVDLSTKRGMSVAIGVIRKVI